MNDNAKAWVAALRSGKCKQGERRLKRVEYGVVRYCCLGVACELAVKAGVIPMPAVINLAHGIEEYAFDGRTCYLPDSVRDWLGARTDHVGFGDDATTRSNVTLLNDQAKFSFEEIANFVEKEAGNLFRDNLA